MACYNKAIHVRQLDIQNDQVRIQMGCLVQRFRSIGGISYDSQTRFIQQQPSEALPNRGSIIDNQDAIGGL